MSWAIKKNNNNLSVDITKFSGIKSLNDNYNKVVVLLNGKLYVSVGNERIYIGKRTGLFEAKGKGFFAAKGVNVELESGGVEATIAVVRSVLGKYKEDFRRITVRDINSEIVGRREYKRRVDRLFPSVNEKEFMVVGETFNYPGKWSSYPPHRHCRDAFPYESKYEEIYYFKVFPKDRHGFIWLYNDAGDNGKVKVIEDNMILSVGNGYHPIVAMPGAKIYYFWALAGKSGKVRSFVDKRYVKM